MSVIIDSDFASLEEAIEGTHAPFEVRDALALVDVEYLSFDGLLHAGQVVVLGTLGLEIELLFKELYSLAFPIERVVPISRLGWNDNISMAHNNSSAFNYRYIAGSAKLSLHALGRAIDINPRLNPCYTENGVYPDNGIYDTSEPGTFVKGSQAVAVFKERGWRWGGDWKSPIDYQHFEKS